MDGVVEVDPHDSKAFDAWYDVYAAAERFGREDTATVWLREEARAEGQLTTSKRRHAMHALLLDGRVVAASAMDLPLLDNLDTVQLTVHTHPDHRRRGHGSRLLDHLEQVARRRGRSVLLTEAAYPFDGPADGRGAAGVEFARAHGFELALGDVMRVLDLPVDEGRLALLAAVAAPHHAAYTLRTFTGRVPDELAQGFAEVGALVATEAPTGDLAIEEEVGDATILREFEEVLALQQRTRFAAVALTGKGQVAAYTDIMVPEIDPMVAYQWGTLVRREHRGHRLGLALKVANHRALQAARSDVRRVVTYNAEVNTHMIGVNERLGFRPVERLGEFQKRLGPPDTLPR